MLIGSDDFEVPLAFPVGDGIEPLTPFPFARRREVIDEVVAEPVARALRLLKDARGLDQRARRSGNILGTDVRAFDRRRRQRTLVLDTVETRDVVRYEAAMLSFLRSEKPEILAKIRDTKTLDDDTAAALKDALAEFGKQFA